LPTLVTGKMDLSSLDLGDLVGAEE